MTAELEIEKLKGEITALKKKLSELEKWIQHPATKRDLIFADNKESLKIYRELVRKKLNAISSEALSMELRDDIASMIEQLVSEKKKALKWQERHEKEVERLERLSFQTLDNLIDGIKRDARLIVKGKISGEEEYCK